MAMGAGIISLLVTLSAGTWIYTKLQRRSGNNTKQSVVASGVAALFVFIVVFSVLTLVF